MEGFSIGCTTCRSRLRVRDRRILGQILPCPKCGSMVFVKLPDQPSQDTEASREASASSGSVSGRSPQSNSFDHIDRLLDEPVRLPAASAAQTNRWRTSQSKPTDPAAVDDSEDHSSEAADPNRAAWLDNRRDAVGYSFMIFGGAIAGLTLAIGLTGWILTRPNSASDIADNVDVAQVESVASAGETVNGAPSGGELAEAELDPSGPASADGQVPMPSVDVSETDTRPSEPASQVTTEVPTMAPPPIPTPEPEPAHPVAAANDDAETQTTTARSVPAAANNNDLAAFAQWLQDADTVEVTLDVPKPERENEPNAETDAPIGAVNDELTILQPTRPAPPRVDVRARLNEPISACLFKDTRLIDTLRLVTQISTIPIRLSPDALGRCNLSGDHPINLKLRDETIQGMLDAIVKGTGLGWVAMEGYVLITTQNEAAGQLITVRHDVTDLSQNDPATTSVLADWITQLIEFGSWQGQNDAAGESAGQCEVDGTILVVTHYDTVQYQILKLCEKLRVARGMAPREPILEDRLKQGARGLHCDALQQPVSVRLGGELTTEQIAAYLERQVPQLSVLVDWPEVLAAGWSPQDRQNLLYEGLTLGEVLDNWLRPKGLTYRVIDGQTLEITTPQALTNVHDVETYSIRERLAQTDITALGQMILHRLGEHQFQPQGRGAVAYDRISQTLIVSLPQPAQRIVDQLIAPN